MPARQLAMSPARLPCTRLSGAGSGTWSSYSDLMVGRGSVSHRLLGGVTGGVGVHRASKFVQ